MLGCKLWRKRDVSLRVKKKLLNTAVQPVMMYNSRACALRGTKDRRLDAFKMVMLRTTTDVRWDDFVRNEEINERLF